MLELQQGLRSSLFRAHFTYFYFFLFLLVFFLGFFDFFHSGCLHPQVVGKTLKHEFTFCIAILNGTCFLRSPGIHFVLVGCAIKLNTDNNNNLKNIFVFVQIWRAVRKNSGLCKNGRVKLDHLNMHQGSPLFYMFRVLSRSLHRHPSAAHGHLHTIYPT